AALRRRVRRHAAPLVLSLRFLYGLRGALALACGATKMPAGRFLLWDLISTLAWAGLYAAAAYWFGGLLSLQAHPLARWALPLLAAALLLAGNAWLSRRARLRLLARPCGDEGGRKGAALTV
ncbi:MAG: VTT domain-containing protein, partial [Thermodesulfobacteriota bacterium]